MENAIRYGTTISYADDTTILLNNKCFEDLYIQAYENMNSLMKYLRANQLQINLTKTKYILFRPNKRKNNMDRPPKLILEGIEIMEVNSTKFLGVNIDNKLNWQDQFKYIHNKLKQNLYIFSVAKNFLPTYAKKLLFNAHICSHLLYASIVWAPMISQTQVNKLQKIINRILLKITNVKKVNNYNAVLKKLRLLKFCDLVDLEQIYVQNVKQY